MIKLNTKIRRNEGLPPFEENNLMRKIRRNEGLPPFEENNLMRNTSFLERTRSIIPRFRQTKSSCLRFFVFHYKSQDYKHQKLLYLIY